MIHRFLFAFILLSINVLWANETVFLGLLIKNNDALIPSFLKSVENLDYDKKQLKVQATLYNDTPSVAKLLNDWTAKQKKQYSEISWSSASPVLLNCYSFKKFALFGDIKNGYLKRAKELNCDYCLIIESDAFLAPLTIKELLAKKQSLISPVLRPIPEENDTQSNFFAECSPADYSTVAEHRQLGTFKVAGATKVYLIQSDCFDKLSFKDDPPTIDESLALAKSASKNEIPYYITNEKEFGAFLHFHKQLTLEEEKKFTLVGADAEVTPAFLDKTFKAYTKNDPDLKEYLSHFHFDKYAIYRIANRDLFYVDEIVDWIKTLYVKRGAAWEPHIYEVLKKYTKPGSVAVDIGGHIGTHTLTLSRLVGNKGKVYVFEPQIKIFPELVINMALNQCKNIVFHRKALGKEAGTVQMEYPCEFNEGMALVGKGGESVKMEKLDSFHLKNVSLIKMDVEGYEIEVLEGAKETIAANKPILVIEITGPETPVKQEKIRKMGYEVMHLGDNDFLCLPSKQ